MFTSIATGIALEAAKRILIPEIAKALAPDNVPVANRDVGRVADAVATSLAPQMVNKANAEPWYQSRVTWGALVSIGTGILALAGYVISPEDLEQVIVVGTAGGTALGGLLTLYGRWKAKKPIGQ